MIRKTLFQNGVSIFKRKDLKHFTDFRRFPETPNTQSQSRREIYNSPHTSNVSNGCGLRLLSRNTHHHSFLQPSVLRPCIHSTSSWDQRKYHITTKLNYTNKETANPNKKLDNENPEPEKHLSIFKRFKEAYKQHGKVLIGVHLFTSTFWAGGCYYLVTSGIDVIGILEWIGFSENIVNKFKSSHLGDIAGAYLFYKLFTPARYLVTLTGTNFVIKYLQKQGKMPKASERERFKDIVKDGQTKLKEKRQEIKEERLERKSKRR